MSVERVKAYFAQFGMEGRVTEHDEPCATVDQAARTMGCEPARIAKTLSFRVDGAPVLVVASGDMRIDNRKFKSRFHTRPRMLSHDEAAELVGHAVGGICPFAVNEGVKVYLDESLRRFETAIPAAGSSNSLIELSVDELERFAAPAGWVDVCKPPEATAVAEGA